MEANTNQQDEIAIKEIFVQFNEWRIYLWSKRLVITVAILIGSCIGLGYALLKKPIYNAELSFALEDEKSMGGLGGAIGLASQFGIDLGADGGSVFSGDNLLGLMKSRSMVEKTLLTSVNIKGKNQTLAEWYISFNNLREKWDNSAELKDIHFLPNVNRDRFTLQQDSILGEFFKKIVTSNLDVDKVDKKLSIVTIQVNSENELFSKYFAERLAKTVSDFYKDIKTQKSVQNVQILQHQTDSVRHELNNAINGVAMSIDAVPNQNPNQQILRAPSQHRQVDVQADQAILTELVKNLEVSKVSLRKETPLIQIIDTPILPLEKVKFSKLKGILIGGVAGFFICIIILLINRFLKKINT